jgi:dipeptidyl aminopeptidase/acylaminoacyl peptidase
MAVTVLVAQQGPATRFALSVNSIMRGPALVGYPPSDLRWSGDSRDLYFVVFSSSNRSPEVFILPNGTGAEARQITTSTSPEWRSFKWVEPELVTYNARDGVPVYARRP